MAAHIERTVTYQRSGKITRESASQFQNAIRGHWAIENPFHHVRDVVLREDACRVRAQPGILARLRSVALNCLRRHQVTSIFTAIFANSLNFSRAVKMAQAD